MTGRRQLGDLVLDRLADARDLGRLPGSVCRYDIERAATDGVGRAVVGDRLEDELALQLEDVADLVEDPREVAVGQLGRLIGRAIDHGRMVARQAATTLSRPSRFAR